MPCWRLRTKLCGFISLSVYHWHWKPHTYVNEQHPRKCKRPKDCQWKQSGHTLSDDVPEDQSVWDSKLSDCSVCKKRYPTKTYQCIRDSCKDFFPKSKHANKKSLSSLLLLFCFRSNRCPSTSLYTIAVAMWDLPKLSRRKWGKITNDGHELSLVLTGEADDMMTLRNQLGCSWWAAVCIQGGSEWHSQH